MYIIHRGNKCQDFNKPMKVTWLNYNKNVSLCKKYILYSIIENKNQNFTKNTILCQPWKNSSTIELMFHLLIKGI